MPSQEELGVFQGVRVTQDGIYGWKANDSNDGTFTAYKCNQDGSYAAAESAPISVGGTPTKMYDREGNEYDPQTGKPITQDSPFGKGPQNIYDDQAQTEQQKLQADTELSLN